MSNDINMNPFKHPKSMQALVNNDNIDFESYNDNAYMNDDFNNMN